MSAKLSNTEILREILSCKEALGLDTLPSAAELYEYGVYSAQLTRVGGLRNVSQMTGIQMKPRRLRTERNEPFTDRTKIRPADLKTGAQNGRKRKLLRWLGASTRAHTE